MGRSLVTQKPIKQLQGLEKFFDIPPLFGNEKRASFFLPTTAVLDMWNTRSIRGGADRIVIQCGFLVEEVSP